MTTRIALAGNPNCGKTTMFNALTGSSQRVGNWPGVTVERKEGTLKGFPDVTVVDLPGIYSLSPYSPEERVSRDYLVEERPDAVLNIVDATNLERNLYLTSQILEVGIPVVVALNMMDTVRKNGDTVDARKLSEMLGCPVVETSALKGEGVREAAAAAVKAGSGKAPSPIRMDDATEKALESISEILGDKTRWHAARLLEKDPYVTEATDETALAKATAVIDGYEKEKDDDSESASIDARYDSIGRIAGACSEKKHKGTKMNLSDRIDRFVTDRWLGLPVFVGVMYVVYLLSMSTFGLMMTDWVNDVFFGEWVIPGARSALESMAVDPALVGLVVDGIISGVGAVLGFLPQMLVLFLLLTILEDCGYMARVAFVMDRLFRRFGLSGKSFIPILVGTGCGIPGIMASRTIEGEQDRKITVMTTTFIPCSAKLPIIALIAGALFGGSAVIALTSYLLGIAAILMSGVILKKIKSMSGEPAPFIMELPPYHAPGVLTVARRGLERCWAFVKKAGTFILLSCTLIWFLSTFNWSLAMVDDTATSMLADMGRAVCWIFTPLGWGSDWEFSVATITGLLAKENVVGTFGVLFGFEEVAEDGVELWSAIAALLTPVAGFSFLVFNLLCAPCLAAIGAMRSELGTWKATAMAVGYQCLFAYAVAMVVFGVGSLLAYGTFDIWTVTGLLSAAVIGYLLVSKDPFRARVAKAEARAC